MTTAVLTLDNALLPRLARLTANVLRIGVNEIHHDLPLAAMGLDSLAAAELTALIEDDLGDKLPPEVLFDCPTLDALSRFIESRSDNVVNERRNGSHKKIGFAEMLADAILPADVLPTSSQCRITGNVLLTGSTGFVGAYLLRSLLRDCSTTVYCLIRPDGTEASVRLRQNLMQYGLWDESNAGRIRCVEGDIAQPLLGMSHKDYLALASSLSAIYHAAAAVDWVRPYEQLREVNVLGTLELLRFACARTQKSLHFLSSLAVCYSTSSDAEALESDDPLSNLAGLNLGYAQSKCVAESLVRQAFARGFRATVVRPALVSGDSQSGSSNSHDLLSRFLRGCIHMGAAPDLDWAMDCVPVDYVADAIVHLGRRGVPGAVCHLSNPGLRYWRECVLWMCLRGYALELIPYPEWAQRLRETATEISHPLYPLRTFFLRTIPGEGDLSLPELYEETRRRRANCDFSRGILAQVKTACPPLDAPLLDRYFESFTARGLIPAAPRARQVRRNTGLSSPLVSALERSLRSRYGDPTLSITKVQLFPMGRDNSIVAELLSWKLGPLLGLHRARITAQLRNGRTSAFDLVLKSKPRDIEAMEVGEQVARLCGPELGRAYREWREFIGFSQGHLRELSIYEIEDQRFRRHTPSPVAVVRNDERGQWMVALECVNDAQVANAWHRPWNASEIEVALRGLAALHSVWHNRQELLACQSWLAPVRSPALMSAMHPLWSALAAHARPMFLQWGGPPLVAAHEALLRNISGWSQTLADSAQTLIHNDFNPRNIMLRGFRGEAPRLCAYDWELATVGAPQRDLAEFLCFVLAPESAADDSPGWVLRYRSLLEQQTGKAIDVVDWDAGFCAALSDFLIDRLAMYAMIHRFRPQAFLPRVMRTWLSLRHRFNGCKAFAR